MAGRPAANSSVSATPRILTLGGDHSTTLSALRSTHDKWGPVVAIEDASGRVWRVCGTTDAKVKKGDTVSAGQTIGKVGSVSCECAEESHIHLEVMEGEKYLDPSKAMK